MIGKRIVAFLVNEILKQKPCKNHKPAQRSGETSTDEIWLLKSVFSKGHLISKENCQAEDSSKIQTNDFFFTSMQCFFVRFLEESLARKKRFEIIWPLRLNKIWHFNSAWQDFFSNCDSYEISVIFFRIHWFRIVV